MNEARYIGRICISLSVLLNTVLGGHAHQTFSARNYDLKLRKKANLVFIIDRVFFFDPDHCLTSWLLWAKRKQSYMKAEKEAEKNVKRLGI